MRVIIEDVSLGAKGVWSAEVDPQRLIKLSSPIRQGGQVNVVLISRPSHNATGKTLQFDLDSAILLNVGNTTETIIIDSREHESVQNPLPKNNPAPPVIPNGDRLFREKLITMPEGLRKLGELLLDSVRKEYPGELVFHPKSEKFVESPDNFWVVRIQPRAQSLRIIVYGRPEEHRPNKNIKLKQDMASYSNFVIDSHVHLNDAVEIIKFAKKLKDQK